jgi:glycosyltransferase involved in cell wall biosynthesis
MAILYAHNELFRTYSKREVGRTLSAMDGLICVSDFLADRLSLRMPASLTDRLRVVVNGVDVNAFHPRTPAARDAQLHVMFVGRVIPEKGPDVLIDALARMQRTDIRLTLVGSKGFSPSAPLSAYERKLRQMAAPLGDRVHFVASIVRQRLPELIRNADVLVVPSRWPEPSGLTVLEGMASGIPVIASSIGGIPQLMGSAGIAVRPDSPEELAEAIRALADDESLRRRVANECRFHAEGRDWSRARAELDGCVYAMA